MVILGVRAVGKDAWEICNKGISKSDIQTVWKSENKVKK